MLSKNYCIANIHFELCFNKHSIKLIMLDQKMLKYANKLNELIFVSMIVEFLAYVFVSWNHIGWFGWINIDILGKRTETEHIQLMYICYR